MASVRKESLDSKSKELGVEQISGSMLLKPQLFNHKVSELSSRNSLFGKTTLSWQYIFDDAGFSHSSGKVE